MRRWVTVLVVLVGALELPGRAAHADLFSDCEQLRDFDRAIKACTRFIAQAKTEPRARIAQAYSNRGFAFAEMGRFDRAILDYDRAIERNPKDDNVYNYRGVAHLRRGRHARALKDFNRAIRLEPKNFYAYENRARAYLLLNKLTEALRSVNKAIRLNPEQAFFYETRGLIHEALNNRNEAIQDYAAAYHLAPLEHYKQRLKRLGVTP